MAEMFFCFLAFFIKEFSLTSLQDLSMVFTFALLFSDSVAVGVYS